MTFLHGLQALSGAGHWMCGEPTTFCRPVTVNGFL